MKLIKIFLISLTLIFTSFAQISDNAVVNKGDGAKTISFTGTLYGSNSAYDTLYSNEFKLSDCETIFYVYRHYSSATSKPRVKLLRQERVFNSESSWTTTDTYSTADSLETYQSARTDTVSATLPVAVRYVIIGAANNPNDTWFEIVTRAKLIQYGKLED